MARHPGDGLRRLAGVHAGGASPWPSIAIAFACQWVSWARIDRAAFQYHYYTSLPFLFLALAYFLAELWHGASRRTWLFARPAAGVAILGPAICCGCSTGRCALRRRDRGEPGLRRPARRSSRSSSLTAQTLAIAVVVGVSVLRRRPAVHLPARRGATRSTARAATRRRCARPARPDRRSGRSSWRSRVAARRRPGRADPRPRARSRSSRSRSCSALPALAVAASSSRRRATPAGSCVGRVVGDGRLVRRRLPEHPRAAAADRRSRNVYQGVLPTYLYPFQFPVNNRPRSNVPIQLLGPVPLDARRRDGLPVPRRRLLGVGLAARARRARGGRRRTRRTRRPAATGGAPARARPARSRGRPARLGEPGRARPRAAGPAAGRLERLGADRPDGDPPSRARGDGGIGAWKPGGSSPRAARRRITTP